MENDVTLRFIKKKLQHIKSAVMYTAHNDHVRLPNDIVEFEEVDYDGHLWFTAHIPRQWARSYEQHFPVKLIFYRKGVDYYVELSGTAVVANKDDIHHAMAEKQNATVLLKMIPYYIEYTETGRKGLPGWRKWKSLFHDYCMSILGFRRAGQPELAGK